MSSLKTLDAEKLRARRIVATATLTAFAIAVLLVSVRSAPVGATPHAAAPSTAVADKQVPSDPPEAEQTVAGQAPREPTPLYLEEVVIAPSPPEPSPAPEVDPEDTSPSANEQRTFRSRKALETINPRDFLRHATVAR
jgi:hypothetical protein